jgi:hypothetical protein
MIWIVVLRSGCPTALFLSTLTPNSSHIDRCLTISFSDKRNTNFFFSKSAQIREMEEVRPTAALVACKGEDIGKMRDLKEQRSFEANSDKKTLDEAPKATQHSPSLRDGHRQPQDPLSTAQGSSKGTASTDTMPSTTVNSSGIPDAPQDVPHNEVELKVAAAFAVDDNNAVLSEEEAASKGLLSLSTLRHTSSLSDTESTTPDEGSLQTSTMFGVSSSTNEGEASAEFIMHALFTERHSDYEQGKERESCEREDLDLKADRTDFAGIISSMVQRGVKTAQTEGIPQIHPTEPNPAEVAPHMTETDHGEEKTSQTKGHPQMQSTETDFADAGPQMAKSPTAGPNTNIVRDHFMEDSTTKKAEAGDEPLAKVVADDEPNHLANGVVKSPEDEPSSEIVDDDEANHSATGVVNLHRLEVVASASKTNCDERNLLATTCLLALPDDRVNVHRGNQTKEPTGTTSGEKSCPELSSFNSKDPTALNYEQREPCVEAKGSKSPFSDFAPLNPLPSLKFASPSGFSALSMESAGQGLSYGRRTRFPAASPLTRMNTTPSKNIIRRHKQQEARASAASRCGSPAAHHPAESLLRGQISDTRQSKLTAKGIDMGPLSPQRPSLLPRAIKHELSPLYFPKSRPGSQEESNLLLQPMFASPVPSAFTQPDSTVSNKLRFSPRGFFRSTHHECDAVVDSLLKESSPGPKRAGNDLLSFGLTSPVTKSYTAPSSSFRVYRYLKPPPAVQQGNPSRIHFCEGISLENEATFSFAIGDPSTEQLKASSSKGRAQRRKGRALPTHPDKFMALNSMAKRRASKSCSSPKETPSKKLKSIGASVRNAAIVPSAAPPRRAFAKRSGRENALGSRAAEALGWCKCKNSRCLKVSKSCVTGDCSFDHRLFSQFSVFPIFGSYIAIVSGTGCIVVRNATATSVKTSHHATAPVVCVRIPSKRFWHAALMHSVCELPRSERVALARRTSTSMAHFFLFICLQRTFFLTSAPPPNCVVEGALKNIVRASRTGCSA